MNLEQLLKLIEDGKTEELKSGLAGILAKIEALSGDISKIEDENLKLKKENEQLVVLTAGISSSLGIKDGELTVDAIKAKITGKDDYKKDLEELEKTIASIKAENEAKLVQKDAELFERKLDLELLKQGTSIKAVSNVALDVILKELKSGLTVDEKGVFVYKDSTGKTLRKDGVTLTINDKLEDLKANKDYGCFFVSEAQSGSGFAGTSTGYTEETTSLTPSAKALAEALKKSGVNI